MTNWLHLVKKLTVFLFACLLCISLAPSALAKDSIHEWDRGETKDTKKVWTIKLNEPIKSSKVRSTTVYVKDENNKKLSTKVTLSSDKKSITVTPTKDYEIGKVYKLYLDDAIRSESDKSLKETIVFPFTILGEKEEPQDEESKLVTKVEFNRTSYATMVTLLTDDTIARVTVNSNDMHYEGNNQYSAGIAGLEAGDTVEIRAYDASEKTVFEKEYTVD